MQGNAYAAIVDPVVEEAEEEQLSRPKTLQYQMGKTVACKGTTSAEASGYAAAVSERYGAKRVDHARRKPRT